ncbi:MAG: hypothetical protein OXI66_01805 [Boseongicola sp.]|nr:hypothetical protein [Boseongicola sp.]
MSIVPMPWPWLHVIFYQWLLTLFYEELLKSRTMRGRVSFRAQPLEIIPFRPMRSLS